VALIAKLLLMTVMMLLEQKLPKAVIFLHSESSTVGQRRDKQLSVENTILSFSIFRNMHTFWGIHFMNKKIAS
jgi:hypothetical protein